MNCIIEYPEIEAFLDTMPFSDIASTVTITVSVAKFHAKSIEKNPILYTFIINSTIMGIWDIFSFSNDDVMDLLQVPIANRTLMISSTDFRHHPHSLQEIIEVWYEFDWDDPVALLDDIVKDDFLIEDSLGVALMFAGNGVFISNYFVAISVKTLVQMVTSEPYLADWKDHRAARETAIYAEIYLLAKTLAENEKIATTDDFSDVENTKYKDVPQEEILPKLLKHVSHLVEKEVEELQRPIEREICAEIYLLAKCLAKKHEIPIVNDYGAKMEAKYPDLSDDELVAKMLEPL
ncbi:MAG: hypothetical protein ACTSYI_09255 [Promethearchaeota archaeon]